MNFLRSLLQALWMLVTVVPWGLLMLLVSTRVRGVRLYWMAVRWLRWALASCCCDAELPRAPAPPPASASLSPPPPPVTRRASAAFISIKKKRSSLGAEKKEVSEGGPRASEKRLRRSPHVIEKREFSVARIQRFDGRKRTRKRKKPSRFSPRQDFFSQSTPGFKLFATES